MGGVKLSELIESLRKDDDLRKLAQDAGVAPAAAVPAGGAAGAAPETETEDSRMVGDTVEDEKEKIQTKLMELAGLQEESISASKTEEELNEAQEAPAGEKVSPPGVNPAASAAAGAPLAKSPAPQEMAEVVASALSGLKGPVRKEACVKIIEKIAQLNVLSLDDVTDEKIATARASEYDAAGRIMARAYHDEVNKLAAQAKEAAGEETESTEEPAADKDEGADAGNDADSGDLTAEELALIGELA